MTDRELMQQALRYMESIGEMDTYPEDWAIAIALRERLAQPEQEPFCYHDGRNIVGKEYADHSDVFPLYTAPSQWQGLTYDEIESITADHDYWDHHTSIDFARAVEAKLKEKNS